MKLETHEIHTELNVATPRNQNKAIHGGPCKVAAVDKDERTVTAIISTDAVDRDMEVLSPEGVKIERFLKNPVVLWSHDSRSLPIGRAMWVKPGKKQISAKVQFAESAQADEIWQLYKGGFLNAFSVGFIPLKSHKPTPEEIRKKPAWAEAYRIHDEWELLEFSPVTVPSNPEALALAVKEHKVTVPDEVKEHLPIFTETVDAEIESAQEKINGITASADEPASAVDITVEVEPAKSKPMAVRGKIQVQTRSEAEMKPIEQTLKDRIKLHEHKGKVFVSRRDIRPTAGDISD